ncbi:ABC transporter ATP-binding protein [Tianweitania sp. BSSL-BM11]|uniref:ABC transporter ATP-binding protein n=1 Tax=Tianweitania aestuarii TaxID=2814886 RepID=A0ABS5RY97_9HYPH|nr:ABC transporter ATP-binding protein [Tianweitania aestuarii]MBS9721991.1 ABC transporter ATP-binding protein [Tianweitania aestuarii]
MLKLSGIKAGYGSMSVLQGLDLHVDKGEIVALLGSNGVGKTTLNNVISGFIRPTAGTVTFKGDVLNNRKPSEIVAMGVAHVPEGRKIFPNLSISENLKLGAFRRASSNISQNFDRVCTIFPRLKERLSQLAGTLSGGEQQMLAIGRGMMSEPELLILDEPSLGLSPIMVEEMFDLITKINADGVSVLLVEQNVMQSLGVAQRAYVIEQGRFVMQGEAATLLADPQLRQAYLGM